MELTTGTPVSLEQSSLKIILKEFIQDGLEVRLRVTGRSMIPALKGGEIVHIRSATADTVRFGELVVWETAGGDLRIHRLLFRRKATDGSALLYTKGDSVSGLDPAFTTDQILGKVYRVENANDSDIPEIFPGMKEFTARCRQMTRGIVSLARYGGKRMLRRIGLPSGNAEP